LSAFSPLTSAFSGLVKFGSDITSGIGNVTHSLTYGFNDFVKFIETIPGDIMDALQNLGFALWHAIQSLGGFLFAGFRDIASAVIGGLNEIRKGFTYIGESLVGLGDTIRKDLVGFAGILLEAYQVMGNFLATVWNDLKEFGDLLWNALVAFWNGLVAFGNDVASAIVNAFDLVGNVLNVPALVSDIPSLVTGLVKQEASRVAGAFSRVIGFNIAIESMKGKVQKGNLGFKDAFLLPIKSAILGTVTEAIMQSFYPEISNVSQYQYNTSKTPPSITSPSVSSTSHQPLTGHTSGQTSFSGLPSPLSPTPFSTTPPHVLGIKIVDEICVGNTTTCVSTPGTSLANVGGYNVGEYVLTFSDTFGVSANLLVHLLQTLGVSVEDRLSPVITAESQFQGFSPFDQLTLEALTTVTTITLPPPLQFCTSSYQPPSTVVNGESETDQLSVYVQECVPLYNLAIDNFYANGETNTQFIQPQYTDTFTANGATSTQFIQPQYTDTFTANGATAGTLSAGFITVAIEGSATQYTSVTY